MARREVVRRATNIKKMKKTQVTPTTVIESGNHLINRDGKWRIYTGSEDEGKGRIISEANIAKLLKGELIKKIRRPDPENKKKKVHYYHVL